MRELSLFSNSQKYTKKKRKRKLLDIIEAVRLLTEETP